MATFIALYRGDSVSTAKLLALSAEPEVVRGFAARLLQKPEEPELDAVLQELSASRRRALRLVESELGE